MKKVLSIVFGCVLVAACVLGMSACGKAKEYGEVKYRGEMKVSSSEGWEDGNEWGAEEFLWEAQAIMNTVAQTEKDLVGKIVDGKSIMKKATLADGYEEEKNAVVVSKWLYYYSLLKEQTISRKDVITKTKAGADCLQKYYLNTPSYKIENEESEYNGKRIYEALASSYEDVKARINAAENPSEEVAKALTESNFTALYTELKEEAKKDEFLAYIPEGSVMTASLAYYGFIDISKVEKGVGKLSVNYKNKDITLNVVGYYETEADKMLEKAVSMDKESKEYKTVLEQLQNPTFYSVCGNFLE